MAMHQRQPAGYGALAARRAYCTATRRLEWRYTSKRAPRPAWRQCSATLNQRCSRRMRPAGPCAESRPQSLARRLSPLRRRPAVWAEGPLPEWGVDRGRW
eukprot:8913088-Alexandrium_andersonii.AAC.1